MSDLGKRFFGARAQQSLLFEGEPHKQNACLRLKGRWTRCRRQAPYRGLSTPRFSHGIRGSTSFWIESKAVQDALKFFDSTLYEPCLWKTLFQNLR